MKTLQMRGGERNVATGALAPAAENDDAWTRRPAFVDAALEACDASARADAVRLPPGRLNRFAGRAVLSEVRTLAYAASILAGHGGVRLACPDLADLAASRRHVELFADRAPDGGPLLEMAVSVMLGRENPSDDALRLARVAAARLGDAQLGLAAFPPSRDVGDALALARHVIHTTRALLREVGGERISGKGERAPLWRYLCTMAADLITEPQAPGERVIACWMIFTEAARVAGLAGRTHARAANEFAALCPRQVRPDDTAAVVRKALASLGHSAGAFANADYQRSRRAPRATARRRI